MSINILKYESDVWKTADLLIASGIKQSDFPKYMMPYFALLMVESRLIREAKRLEEEIGRDNIEDFVEMFQLEGLGYNDYVIRKNKSLKDICKNDKTFDVDFHSYLKSFDPETKYLLGVDKGTEEEKFLDISGISGQLKKKRILFETVKAWSEIDLTPFSNSEITTLEEHIKRKWADISAETAGEQYTPDDIISLITELIASKIEDSDKFLTIYDPTCGGGNLLFGVEDKIKENFKRPTKTFGEDWNDSLYALAKIESRFRQDSEIKYGNTLTNISFIEKKFDVIVANPPHGIPWDGYKKDIYNDTTERFIALPAISDGQLLFAQHNLFHLSDEGIAVVVHNGSSLFGDAGSGESNIRKYFFDKDWVEAIIQLPTDEFFNTNIYTYLWVFNKNKDVVRKDKIILINASELFENLTKSRGKKRKQMSPDNRKEVVDAFTDFSNNIFSKVYNKWHFYYNKQSIMLTNVDENGKYIEMPNKINRAGETVEEKSIKLAPTKIEVTVDNETTTHTAFEITSFDKSKHRSLQDYFNDDIKPTINAIDYKEQDVKVFTKKATYWYDQDKETIIEEIKGKKSELGCGKIVIKSAFKKATKTKVASIVITVELTKDLQKDFDIIPYSPDIKENEKRILSYITKYNNRPFELLDNNIGTEVYFNKLFYKPITINEISSIESNIIKLKNELNNLNSIVNNVITKGVDKKVNYKDSGIPWVGQIPVHWEVKRFKDVVLKYTTGGTPPTSNVSYFEGENIWICISDINDSKHISDSKIKLTSEAIKVANIPVTPKGSLLYSFKLSIGKVAFTTKDCYTNEAILSIFPNKKIDLGFYYYMLPLFLMLAATENIYGAKMLNQKLIANALVVHPPIEEQKQIADFLSSKTELIDSIYKSINDELQTLKDLKDSVISKSVMGNLN